MFSTLHRAIGIKTRLDPSSDKELLLTFDDGPDPVVTGQILDELDKFDAKAVFFVVGNRINKAQHMLNEVLHRGHLLGNHSHSHWSGKPPSSIEYKADLEICQKAIFEVSGFTPTLYRPPLGTVSLATVRSARSLQMEVYKWSLDTNDWQLRDDAKARKLGPGIANQARHRDIVLMHDDNSHSPVLLREMLPRLVDNGFNMHTFVKNRHNHSARSAR